MFYLEEKKNVKVYTMKFKKFINLMILLKIFLNFVKMFGENNNKKEEEEEKS